LANPKTEDGYLQVANELWEAIARLDLSGGEFRVLLAILRKLYGFKKKEDWVTNRQLSSMTGLRVNRCSEAVSRLAKRGVISIPENRKGYRRKIRFNKDFDTWRGVPKNRDSIPKKRNTRSAKTEGVSRKTGRRTTKETLDKETLFKEKSISPDKIYLTEEQDSALTEWLTVSCKKRPNRGLLAEQLIKLWAEFPAVDFVSLARTCRAWYEGEGKKCGNLSLAMRNFAKKAIEFGRDLRTSVDGITAGSEAGDDGHVPWPKPPPAATDDDKDLWRAVLAAVKETVEIKEFDTWLQPTRVAGRTSGEVWVEVPNWFYADFINENYLEAIKAALVGAGMPETVEIYVGIR
jgi:phage replication O-like protein O